LLLMLSAVICRAQEFPAANLDSLLRLPAETVSGPLRQVKTEPIGPGSSRAWLAYYPPFMEMSLYQDPNNNHWMHLISFKKKGKDERITHFALIDIDDGTITEVGSVPGWEQYKCLWVNKKLYLGMNNVVLPGRLVEFDPATRILKDLESPFKKAGSLHTIAVDRDGVLALGGDPQEVALYDPRTGGYTYYGMVGSPSTNKVYYISIDEDYIYAAARGTDPWRLIAINRKTQERRELMQVPVEGILALDRRGTIWTTANTNDDSLPKQHYHVQNGEVHKVATAEEALQKNAELIAGIEKLTPPPRKEAPPQCFRDESPTYLGKPEMTFIYQKPGEDKVWREIAFPIPLANHALNRLVQLANGRLAYSGEKYSPLTVWDPRTQRTLQVPSRTDAYANSIYSMAAVDNVVFAGGYSGSIVMAFDPDKPITQTMDLPGRKGVPFKSPEANPRLVGYFSEIAKGAHTVIAMEVGADDLVYLCARRHRYFFGFDICWFDPKDYDRRGVLEAGTALDHYQMSWMCLTPDKETLVASAYVEGNPQIDSPHPTDAKLFFFDLRKKGLRKSVTPLPQVKALSGVAIVGPSTLVGAAYLADQKETVLYRLNLETDKVEMTRKYKGMLHGKPGTVYVPAKGYDFAAGPDGRVWTLGRLGEGDGQTLLRIDPRDLSAEPVCAIGVYNIRFLFSGKDLILTGGERLQRIRDVVER
ncbi:MAG: hypothetical protein GX595_08165, partial [Lentisphaerae bacterium]|nr:hypothetical protein [Lentisphaerota bacterium]